MKTINVNGNEYRLPGSLSEFQQEIYIHLIDWKWRNITKEPGVHGKDDTEYDAILPDSEKNKFAIVYPEVVDALKDHIGEFPFRVHKYFDHMASSQAANINLFLPVLLHPKADEILRGLRADFDRLDRSKLFKGFRVEYWDEGFESLKDKTDVSGTDSDIGIAYINKKEEPCLWLIEHKLTEPEFTTCGGYKSDGKKDRHDCGKTFAELVEAPQYCYYHDVKNYTYWKITADHRDLFPNHARHPECPFSGGMNQLWRNQLLALAIEQDGNHDFKDVTFSVVRHPLNRELDKTLASYRHLINDNCKFTTLTSADVIAAAEIHADKELRKWITWYKSLYKL